METLSTPKRESNELEVTGVSRSGRVCKKSSKLMDFDYSSNVIESKPKKPKLLSPQDSLKKKRVGSESHSQSPVPHVTQTIHVAQIHHPPSNRIIITTPKRSPKLVISTDQKKKKIEPSSDYETQSQSTNSESDEDVINRKLHIAEVSRNNISIDAVEPAEDEIVPFKKKVTPPKKVKKSQITSKQEGRTKEIVLAKPKTKYTAYMLWSKEKRQELLKECPSLDFSSISRRLGELWATVPNQEKYNWSNRAKRLCEKNQATPTKKFIINQNVDLSGKLDITDMKKISLSQLSLSGEDAIRDPSKDMKIFRAIELQPIDVAAYLKLLGESLTVIGERLKEHNGQITVSGSLSVLLDSLLCALGSLMCLTQQVPSIGNQNTASLSKTLENIAYIMPGL
ncbi:hypothetical protein QAD02_016222 [Eretmocerus hayati]|uniref:Uncharacterized protein n=1 Tax=Eretmocerus hayati TaxID=131215 RepID=A0ACC2PAJ5_9HYME|nr:hypothetical protein QAD02_016222 [Eretmocerus hayati]